jgi:hypothetical protein
MDQAVPREQSIHYAEYFRTGTTINPAGSLRGGASFNVGGTKIICVEVGGSLSLRQQLFHPPHVDCEFCVGSVKHVCSRAGRCLD